MLILRAVSCVCALVCVSLGPAGARAGEIHDRFGEVIVADGERVAVAAPGSNVAAFDGGLVEVFVRDGDGWRREQQLAPAGVSPFSRFGAALALSGDVLVAVALADGSPSGVPSAHVFERGSDGWQATALLTFGTDVTELGPFVVGADGDWAALGTPYLLRGGEPKTGEVHLYRRTDAGWLRGQVLVGPQGPWQPYVRSLALADGALVLWFGDRFEVHELAGDTWQLAASLPSRGFEWLHAFDGETLLVFDDETNVLRAYARSDAWAAVQAPELGPVGHVQSLAVSGDWAGLGLDTVDSEAGQLALFVREGATWSAAGVLTREDETFAAALAIGGEWVWAGEPAWSADAPGEAFAYHRTGAVWQPAVAFEAGPRPQEAGCAVDRGGWPTLGLLVLAAWRRRRRV